ncbi:hypothetical protein C8F04DRAFT_1178345 [Mycena alexandri]|uniref:Uncharacterized protein n=1 Tax=Mycena alexandri TaxID=1745969 RepID=A0AAD6T8Y9_9AGAR|nr:hypothetical protein C8F04DRAFT_1178345 [Mycena alexandri]
MFCIPFACVRALTIGQSSGLKKSISKPTKSFKLEGLQWARLKVARKLTCKREDTRDHVEKWKSCGRVSWNNRHVRRPGNQKNAATGATEKAGKRRGKNRTHYEDGELRLMPQAQVPRGIAATNGRHQGNILLVCPFQTLPQGRIPSSDKFLDLGFQGRMKVRIKVAAVTLVADRWDGHSSVVGGSRVKQRAQRHFFIPKTAKKLRNLRSEAKFG